MKCRSRSGAALLALARGGRARRRARRDPAAAPRQESRQAAAAPVAEENRTGGRAPGTSSCGSRSCAPARASRLSSRPDAPSRGSGVLAGADMTSLDATCRLWTARIEPRRRIRAVGTYTHILDQWAIICDRPVMLNQRQAGVAIGGALRQELAGLRRLAVDPHGFMHFAMATAKLLGFGLCPRLAELTRRRLYLPKGYPAPATLEPVIERMAVGKAAREGWDGLLKLVASLKAGYASASTMISATAPQPGRARLRVRDPARQAAAQLVPARLSRQSGLPARHPPGAEPGRSRAPPPARPHVRADRSQARSQRAGARGDLGRAEITDQRRDGLERRTHAPRRIRRSCPVPRGPSAAS